MRPQSTDALLVVDVQRDFCDGGALGVEGGSEVVPLINSILPRFQCIVFSRDWHPANHCSFSDAPQFVDASWPVHCVQDTPGAAFHASLEVPEGARIVSKATDPSVDAYSAFEGTDLESFLRDASITRVYVCGLATDYCVKATALDAKAAGFEVVVLADACRAVDPESEAINVMHEAGVVLGSSEGFTS